jgi:methyl-accepting chemotaxis protein
MKIMAKLLIAFLSVAALCFGVAYISLSELRGLSDDVKTMADQTIPAIDYVTTVSGAFRELKNHLRSMANPLAADDETFINRQLSGIEKQREIYRPALEKYEALPKMEKELALFDTTKNLLTVAVAYTGKVSAAIDVARKLSPGPERDAAYITVYRLISGDERLAYDNLQTNLDEIVDFVQEAYGVQIATKAVKNAARAQYIVLGVGIISLVVAIVLGFLMGRSISGRLKGAVRILDKIAQGDLSERSSVDSRDEFRNLAESMNSVENNVNALVTDTAKLVQSALEGNLSVRADPEQHKGEYRRVIEGINATLDAVVGPLTVAADYIDRIAQGNLPQKIAETYNGDFNKIKDNLNLAIDSINALIRDTNVLTEAAAAGTLQTRADPKVHQGDYRKIIEGINATLDFVITPLNELSDSLRRLAEGDMTAQMNGAYNGDFDALKQSFNSSVLAIGDTLSQINIAVDQVAGGAVQVSQASQALSQGATEQAASLEEITSSTTEISGQTKQNTENALRMNSLAREAQENAEKGNNQMKDLVAAMNDINTSAEQIKKVVETIDDIAFQINLLALNANVEAARAGKYGKGFAVVAEEVRNLAVRSASSVKDTTRMVDEAISSIQKGNTIVDGTAVQLEEIVSGAAQVAQIAEEVATAGREQTQGLEQITIGLNQIDQVTQSNTASSEESASASEELSSQAQQVKGMVARFKLRRPESGLNSPEAIAALRAELAARDRSTPLAKPGFGTAQASTYQAPQATPTAGQHPAAKPSAPKPRPVGVRPADIISLDDGNFGKF